MPAVTSLLYNWRQIKNGRPHRTEMQAPALRPGPLNLITDVEGIRVGNAEDRQVWTGVSVVLPERPALAAVDVRGGAPGTRETDALDPTCAVDEAHAVVLSGGSAFGLEAASAVQLWLAARGIGFRVGTARVPIVPSAILFDLLNGGDKAWGENPPYRALARTACEAAGSAFALGNAGAGYGAKAGRLKGGLGSASVVSADGLQVGALIAANPRGSLVVPGTTSFWAAPLEQEGELGGQAPLPAGAAGTASDLDLLDPRAPAVAGNTTIGVVATNAVLSKAEARRVAIMAQDGYARAIRPAHTPFDGDTVFVLATGALALPEPRIGALARLGSLAADCVARAAARGVYEAETLGSWTGYRDIRKP
jgi:L-aminopeptidase/D-esterase-like protein